MNGHDDNGNGTGEHLPVAGHSNIHVIPHHPSHHLKESGKIRWQRFLHGGKWQNFAAGIATGAAYISLSGIHWHPDWLTVVETVLFMLNCTIFVVNFVLIFVSARIKNKPLIHDFSDPAVALVVPLVTIDFATICVGIYQYGHRLGGFHPFEYATGFIAVYWFYFAFALLTSIPVTFGWFGSVGKTHELSSFSLTGCFLVFPIMLVGTMAVNALERIPAWHPQTVGILVTGYILQGIGFGIASCFIIVSQYRAIRYGFNRGASAATGFLACGPFGYTALVLIRLGDLGRDVLRLNTALTASAADIIYYSTFPAVFFLVGLNFYFFIFNFIPWAVAWRKHLTLCLSHPGFFMFWLTDFVLMVAGLVLTLTALGNAFDSIAFRVVQVILAAIIISFYCVIFVCWVYRLIWPADQRLRDVRSMAWNQEHLSFWSSWREAEQAEREYRQRTNRRLNADPLEA